MMKIPKLHSRMWLHEFNASARVSNARTARANWKCKTGAGQVISVCALGWCLNEKKILILFRGSLNLIIGTAFVEYIKKKNTLCTSICISRVKGSGL